LISVANDTGTGSDSTSTQGTNNDYTTFFCLAQNNQNQYFLLWYKNNPNTFGNTTAYGDDVYRQIIMNWSTSGANMTFTHYLNGVYQTASTIAQTAYTGANNITLAMNCAGAVSNPVTDISKIAYSIVRLYSKTLSQAEITQNYNATKSRFNLI